MVVNLYTFSKRKNSTAVPVVDLGISIEGYMKESCGIINPSIDFNFPQDTNLPSQYNYVYIPVFKRYYYVKEWTWSGRLWTASLECDPLASWRTAIGESNQYILRSSAHYDGSILDTFYPAKTDSIMEVTPFNSAFTRWNDGGSYIIGIVNKDSNKVGCTTYYSMTGSQFNAFTDVLLNDSASWLNIDSSELSVSLQKALVNPMQYITSVAWYPLSVSGGTTVDSIPFGWWAVTASATRLSKSNLLVKLRQTITVPKHPNSATRGAYLNCSPYSRYTLYYPPWGEIPIDTTIIQGNTTLDITIGVDLVSGAATLVASTGTGEVVGYFQTTVSVPISIAQTTTDYRGLLSSAFQFVGGVADAAVGIGTAKPLGVIDGLGSMASGILSGAYASAPQVQSAGQSGSISSYDYVPHIRAQFFIPVNEDNSDFGRPLCSIRTVEDLPGFLLVGHPEISIAATSGEIDQILAYMSGGFYYE